MLDVTALSKGETVCAFIRHGEKDVDHYGLTNAGKAEIGRIGQLIAALNRPVRLCASPEGRCMETAALLAEKILRPGSGISTSAMLGKPGIQVKDEGKYKLLTDRMRCRDIYREWKMGRHDDAMHTPAFIRTEILQFLRKTSLQNGITIYVSQSGTIACAGYALGLADYRADDDDWVKYLDGFVVGV